MARRHALTASLLLLAACSTQPSEPPGDTIADWWAGNSHYTAGLETALSDASDAAESYDTSALAEACERLENVASDALDAPPIPDPDIQEHWYDALVAYQAAGIACHDGAVNIDSDALSEAADLMDEGREAIDRATAGIEETAR